MQASLGCAASVDLTGLPAHLHSCPAGYPPGGGHPDIQSHLPLALPRMGAPSFHLLWLPHSNGLRRFDDLFTPSLPAPTVHPVPYLGFGRNTGLPCVLALALGEVGSRLPPCGLHHSREKSQPHNLSALNFFLSIASQCLWETERQNRELGAAAVPTWAGEKAPVQH